MKILFYFGHPAQYLFARRTISDLQSDPATRVKILIKTKDVLEDLLISDGLSYENILHQQRGNSKFSIIWSLALRVKKILSISRSFKPDVYWGGDPSIAFVSRILRKDCIIVGEDDYQVIYRLAKITYPFATAILCPVVCDVGPFEKKKIGYQGYMKLAYLHPNIFSFNKKIVEKYTGSSEYVLIRLSELKAYHDEGVGGFTEEIIDELLLTLKIKFKDIFISAEGKMDKKYNSYLLKPVPSDMVHLLASASLFIGDSQSMTVEACMLGVPSIRFSGFVGKISVLEELDNRYGLTFGVDSANKKALIERTNELMNMLNRKEEFLARRNHMLSEKIDVSEFLTNFLRNYPASLGNLKGNSHMQNRPHHSALL